MHDNFQVFGAAHLAVLASVPLLAALLATIQRRLGPESKWLRIGLASMLLADTIGWYVSLAIHGELKFPERMPLELCDATLFLMIVALFDSNAAIFDVAYYTALAGATMALLTPNVFEPFPSLSTIQFFFAHGVVVISVLFLVWSRLERPRPGSVRRAMLAVNAYALIVGAFDFIFKTDFMYLRAKPARGSLLDLLGPWPWYLLITEVVALILFLLLYLPFCVANRKRGAAASA